MLLISSHEVLFGDGIALEGMASLFTHNTESVLYCRPITFIDGSLELCVTFHMLFRMEIRKENYSVISIECTIFTCLVVDFYE